MGCRVGSFFYTRSIKIQSGFPKATEIRFFCRAVRIEKILTPFCIRIASRQNTSEVLNMDHGKIVNKSIEYIEEHLDEQLSPDIIAANAGYSVYHFSRLFKECTGKSVMSFVRDRRLELAQKEFGGNRICDIAEKFGYETASGFCRAYKRRFGIRPGKSRMNA